MVNMPTTQEEADAMKAAAAAYERGQAQEAYDALAARLQPLSDLVEGEAFAAVLDGLCPLVADYEDMPRIIAHLRPAPDFLARLRGAVRDALVPPALLVEPADEDDA